MNRRFIWILAFLTWNVLIAGGVGFAYNWQPANIKVMNTVKAGGQTTLTLQDKDLRLFKVSYPGDNLPDDVAAAIIKYKTEFFAWRNLEIKEIKFILSLDILDIMIIPARIMYNGANIASVIPAGIIFIYDPAAPGNGLQYDFKILKDNLIARVTGKYTTEAGFEMDLFRAYENPKAYLPSGQIESSPTGKAFEIISETPLAKPDGKSTITPTGIPKVPDQTGSIGSGGLTNADFEFLLDKIIQLQVENERLRCALLALENRELFKQVDPISREVTLQVIRLKRQYPTLTFNDLLCQLKKDGVKITKQELFLILAVYFNEFYDQYL
ncbi:MAG: hypothetical protein K6U80_11860 [Firmicutes bacterium]|nr:hypothetical protein [Bacillota bacterium]